MSWIRDEMDVSNGLRRDELQPGLQMAVHVIDVGDSVVLFQHFDGIALFVMGSANGFAQAFAPPSVDATRLQNTIDL